MAISRIGNNVDVTVPAWLYELLPLFYITIGVLAAMKLDGLLAIASSALLIVVGIHILRLRARYRESLRLPDRARKHFH